MSEAPEPKEIRERYDDYRNEWKHTYDEGDIDMRYVAGDPWEPEDRKAREDSGRPCISLDEITQYLNQAINNIRQNKRAIQVNPTGDGSNDKVADLRSSIIRGIEYRSNAQAAYITAAENQINRSFGFAKLCTTYIDDDSFDQDIRIKCIQNPKTVLIDPNYKEPDASDMEDAFEVDLVRKSDFKRLFPKAKEETSFTSEELSDAGAWVRDKFIQTAAYWKVVKSFKKLLLVEGPGKKPLAVFEDELKSRQGIKILRDRQVETRKVIQYITNGLEILEENPWMGSKVPILGCFGKELWIDDGSGAKRHLLSMVRLARDPQMLHAFLSTQEAEEAGMSPKSPFVGYKGQFESDWEAWENVSKIPRGFLQVDPMVEAAGGQVLPLPTRPQFVPNFQAYEMAKESARRAIQAAMGISPLPTAAQRQNEKSGVALQHIASQEAIGAFHFTDNYDRFLENAGRQINELIPLVMDSARTVPGVNEEGQHAPIRVNDPEYAAQNPNEDHVDTQEGEYDVTISTGPSYDSQRQEASEFVDTLIANLKNIPAPPELLQKLFALAIKLKPNLGPIGAKIADLLDPEEQNSPEQLAAQNGQLKQQLQAIDAFAKQAQEEIKKLQDEKQAKIIDNQFRMEIEKLKAETSITMAEISTKAQTELQRLKFENDMAAKLHVAAHEQAMATVEHGQNMEAQASDQAHQSGMADQQAANQSQLQDQSAQNAMAQQAQAADLQSQQQPEAGA